MATVTLKGNAVEIAGTELKAGDAAPDFSLQNTSLEEITLASSAGKTRIIATIPSLDTPVCHAETKNFNAQAEQLANAQVLVVSTDLPFGQKRWCGAEGVDSVKTLSAHRSTDFGENYGVMIIDGPLAGMFSRAVVVRDENNTVVHSEMIEDITTEPNYGAAFRALGIDIDE